MEALEILGPIIEAIYSIIVESRRIPEDDFAGEGDKPSVSYERQVKLTYGFSRKICATI
jgi:hypothetical protein